MAGPIHRESEYQRLTKALSYYKSLPYLYKFCLEITSLMSYAYTTPIISTRSGGAWSQGKRPGDHRAGPG